MAAKGRKRRNYYLDELLGKTEEEEMRRAASLEGLVDEITVLRRNLKRTLVAPDREAAAEARRDLRATTAGVETLLRAVGTQHRISPQPGDDMGARFAAALNSIGDQILPADR